MSKLVVTSNLTLDGVMQAPGRSDEDTRGGFEHGGWALPYNDEVMGRVMGERMAEGGPLLLGRRTYEDLYGFWPNQPENPFTEVLNNVQKYVASTTLQEPLPWSNSTLLEGRRRRGRGRAQAAIGQGHRRAGEWGARSLADASWSHRRVRVVDTPAGSRIGAPPLPRGVHSLPCASSTP